MRENHYKSKEKTSTGGERDAAESGVDQKGLELDGFNHNKCLILKYILYKNSIIINVF